MFRAIKIDPEANEIRIVDLTGKRCTELERSARQHLGAERLATPGATTYGDIMIVDPDRPMGGAYLYLRESGRMIAGPALIIADNLGLPHDEPMIPLSEVRAEIEMIDAHAASDWIRTWAHNRPSASYPRFRFCETMEQISVPPFYSVAPRRALDKFYA